MSDSDDAFDGDYQSEQLQPEETLADGELTDVLDRGYSPPDRRPVEHPDHEDLDRRLAEEEPEVYDAEDGSDPDFPSDGEAGARRAGRLVAPDEGTAADVDAQMLAHDTGVDGAGASAEEAAMHVIDDSR
ncbi:MAG: DUF5709 domain-containing protein [Gordonia sp. (in: high G+C Gram-positive bacteria)]|uniref:DUF5709 domain-containing protein n=1 Tax=Gordonia sp. (in: high G+C Gram-positive bacteria) TaxID=84139 RepID=UPI0039E58DA0